MGSLSGLFNAAAADVKFSSDNENSLTKESNVQDVLDWIMVKLCSQLDVNEMAFKGGYVLSKLLPVTEARGTRDIDFSIVRREYYDNIKRVMSSIGDTLISLGMCASYTIKDTVEPMMSGGVNYYMVDETKHIGIDVGLHDISYGIHEVTLTGVNVNAFTTERMLADKISAMFTRKRFRRSKDLYDLYVISNNFNVDMSALSDLISRRGELDYEMSPIREEIMDGYRNAYEKLRIDVTSDYGHDIEKPSFKLVIGRLRLFVEYLDTVATWDHVTRRMLI